MYEMIISRSNAEVIVEEWLEIAKEDGRPVALCSAKPQNRHHCPETDGFWTVTCFFSFERTLSICIMRRICSSS